MTTGCQQLLQPSSGSAPQNREADMLHTPEYDGVRPLTRRASESSAGVGPSLSQVSASELVQQSSSRIEAVEQLLSDCFHASDNNEQRLLQLRQTQASMEEHIAQLAEGLTRQAALLETSTRGGGSPLSHRSGSASSRGSERRAFSAGPKLRYR